MTFAEICLRFSASRKSAFEYFCFCAYSANFASAISTAYSKIVSSEINSASSSFIPNFSADKTSARTISPSAFLFLAVPTSLSNDMNFPVSDSSKLFLRAYNAALTTESGVPSYPPLTLNNFTSICLCEASS